MLDSAPFFSNSCSCFAVVISVSPNFNLGWDKCSYGYHGDDGNFFCSSGSGSPYGRTFSSNDTVGCGINLVSKSIFSRKME